MTFLADMNIIDQAWIECGSGEHRSQEGTRKIEEINEDFSFQNLAPEEEIISCTLLKE